MLDENEFLSPYGIRSLSRFHADHPYVFHVGGQEYRVSLSAGRIRHRHVRRQLELARADLDAGQRADHPRAAAVLHATTATTSPSNVPTGSGRHDEPVPGRRGNLAGGCRSIFLQRRGRPAAGLSAAAQKFQDDPHWRDCLLFYEYFHGDNGAGLGASHQTGWTGVIARAHAPVRHADAGPTPQGGSRKLP